ncbi:MAG: hypothetical protein HY560_12030 [Gemmatimonadetes bacterium]|nr:hypothetical protein [Gemmatimonadota bacterium]
MPLRYRVLLVLLGAFLLSGGVLGLLSAPRLHGFAALRGWFGGIVAVALGAKVVGVGYSGRLPAWLAGCLGGRW